MSDRDPFYVGYLNMPAPHRRFLLAAVPVAVLLIATGALGMAVAQKPWGTGEWMMAEERSWTGVIQRDPYPLLHVCPADATPSTPAGTYLLVGMMKSAPSRESLPDAPSRARLTGFLVRRDGRRLISAEIAASAEGPLEVLGPGGSTLGLTLGDESATLRGEIMDSKCYLGAMQPGEGRGHKACATLCISGGIPPVLVSKSPDGSAVYHLLVDSSGAGLTGDALEAIKPVIGEAIEISGTEGTLGSWRVLAIDPDAARPL